MNKSKINNEIILLRKDADQARVNVIKKLSRNILKLNNKKGTEEQKAKNEKKAKRYANEIFAIKKVKKDEITKFALSNTSNLIDILENINSDSKTRILARIADFKKFKDKITAFKSKYPDYAEYLGPGKRKKQKLEKKEKIKTQNGTFNSAVKYESDNCKIVENGVESDNNQEDESISNKCNKKKDGKNKKDSIIVIDQNHSPHASEHDNEDEAETDSNVVVNENIIENSNSEDHKEIVCNKSEGTKIVNSKSLNLCKIKVEETSDLEEEDKILSEKRKNLRKNEENLDHSKPKKAKKTPKKQKQFSKDVVVKKFTEILNDSDNFNENREKNYDAVEKSDSVEKEVDPFFMSKDGKADYLSVALPISRKKIAETDNNDDFKFNNRHSSHKHNSNFFNVSHPRGDNFKKNKWPDSKWEGQQKNMNPYKKEKQNHMPFDKFGDKSREKPKFNKNKESFGTSKEVLHPSWEAKKKQQELIKKGPQGKKIVFDD